MSAKYISLYIQPAFVDLLFLFRHGMKFLENKLVTSDFLHIFVA